MFDSLFGFWKILIIFVVQKFQNHYIIHYLDDDLFVGEQNTGTLHCVKLAEIVKLTCRELGIPINEKKPQTTEGSCTRLSFLHNNF